MTVPLLTLDEFADWLVSRLGLSATSRPYGVSYADLVLDSLEMTEATLALDEHGIPLDAGMLIDIRNLGDLYRAAVFAVGQT